VDDGECAIAFYLYSFCISFLLHGTLKLEYENHIYAIKVKLLIALLPRSYTVYSCGFYTRYSWTNVVITEKNGPRSICYTSINITNDINDRQPPSQLHSF